ncbi:MAG: DUF89 family protein [Sulfurovaceae bacterium]|nr:DUF89 family protein [Sulfurovaceae bacterium]
MNLKSDCLSCLLNQSLRVAKALEVDEEKSKELLQIASASIATYGEVSPPVAASDLYPKLANFIGVEDIYENLKADSSKEALRLLPMVKRNVNSVSEAIKASVAGNVIDFATPNHFDLDEEFAQVFQTPFAIDDEALFLSTLSHAKSFMIIGDNVGEHIFDKLLLEEIAKAYPNLKIYYAVRGRPIINDVTLKEAKEIGIEKVAILVDSGVDTPGLAYERASDEFMELYNSMDLIIAKGMGNYECLEGVEDERIYHLFKVKCDVVASTVRAELGGLIFKKNIKL